MQYNDEDLFVYQLMDMLVCEYNYKIVNVPGNKRDVWLANDKHESFPMIRLTSVASTSTIFEKEYLLKVVKALSVIINANKPLLILNTNKESMGFVEEGIQQVVVGDCFISDNAVVNAFPSILTKIHKVTNNQSECARLMRHLENDQRKKVKEANRFSWKKAPKASIIIAAICVIAYLACKIVSHGSVDSTRWFADVVICGGYYKPLIVYGGEYWRFFTSTFIHYDIFTLLYYSITMYHMGKDIEKHYKFVPFLLIFITSATIGNACTYVFEENVLALGMAGGLFGIYGAYLVYAFENNMFKNPIARFRVTQISMIAMTALIFTGADLAALIGGLCTGIFVSVILSKSAKVKELKKHFVICSMLSVLCLGYGVSNVYNAYPEADKQNTYLIEEYERLGLVKHAEVVDNYLKKAYEEY